MAARDDENRDILVSAGAGSGKTTILTARVLRKLEQGSSLRRLLILTFTENAAASMKEKIRKEMAKEVSSFPSLASQMPFLASSDIMTFDAFNHKLVKKYFYKLGISPDFGIVSGSLLQNALNQIIQDVFKAHYEQKDPVFLSFLEDYTVKDDGDLVDLVYKGVQAEMSRSYPEKDFAALKDDALKGSPRLLEQLDGAYGEIYQKALKAYHNFFAVFQACSDDDAAYGEIKKKAVKEYQDTSTAYDLPSLMSRYDDYMGEKLQKKRNQESDFREAYDKAKGAFTKYFKSLKSLVPARKKAEELLLASSSQRSMIVGLIQESYQAYQAYKKAKNVFEFNDIAHMALSLLSSQGEVLSDLASAYDEIMVDEYQDNNDLQESFLESISQCPEFKGHLFMVGDVKQSIYGFRHSDPSYFMTRYGKYQAGEKGAEMIPLNDSFRSAPKVVSFINSLFSVLMSDDFGGADYEKEHQIIQANGDLRSLDLPVSCLAYSLGRKGNGPDFTCEAKIIADDILRRIRNGEVVNVGGESHLLSFRDFTLICDTGTDFEQVAKVFKKMHIPLRIEKNKDEREAQILWLVKALLSLYGEIEEGRVGSGAFQHAFLCLARGPLFKAKESELNQAFLSGDYVKTPLYQQMEEAVKENKGKDIYLIYADLLQRFQVFMALRDMPDPTSAYQFLMAYDPVVKSMALLGYTASQAGAYFKNLSSDTSLKAELTISSAFDNAVTLTNVHKSKGLEYPVVYYIGLSKKYNLRDLSSRFSYDPSYGPILPFLKKDFAEEKEMDPSLKQAFENPLKTALAYQEERKQKSEKLRLFYVSLTRAQYQIILLIRQEEDKAVLNPEDAVSFKDLLDYFRFKAGYQPYQRSEKVSQDGLKETPYAKPGDKMEESVIFNYKEMGRKLVYGLNKPHTASIGKATHADSASIAFGQKLHLALQIADLEKKDLSFITDASLLSPIRGFLNSDFLKKFAGYEAYKEYGYVDRDGNLGSIDLLLVGKDDLAVVDYKLKSLDNDAYARQVKTYVENATRLFAKPGKGYLYSLLTSEWEEVC